MRLVDTDRRFMGTMRRLVYPGSRGCDQRRTQEAGGSPGGLARSESWRGPLVDLKERACVVAVSE